MRALGELRISHERRRVLAGFAALAAGAALPACRGTTEPGEIFHELVSDVIARDVTRLRAETRELHRAVLRMADEPNAGSQQETREALGRTLPVWKRASAFRAGPFAESHVFLRAMFWPVRTSAVDGVLDAPRRIDEGLVEQLGANQKGLYALEYLLFGRVAADRSLNEQERRFAREVSANVLGYAERGASLFGDGSAYARRFAGGGRDFVSKLAELTTDAVEIVFGKLDRVARRAARGQVGAAEVEGYFSGTSLPIALALLAGAEALFAGGGSGGLGALVRAISPPVEARVKRDFANASRRLSALGAPLERSVLTKRKEFEAVMGDVRALERALKLEVASALGLSLVFPSGDGD